MDTDLIPAAMGECLFPMDVPNLTWYAVSGSNFKILVVCRSALLYLLDMSDCHTNDFEFDR